MFTTLATVKEFVGITSVNDDALLTRLINDASTLMQSWLSRDITSATYTQKLDGKGIDEITLTNYPITAVSALTIDGITPTAYGFDDNNIYLTDGSVFTKGKRNITVTYTAGFTTVPTDLEQVCVDLVATKYRERDRIGLDSKALAGETTAFSTRDFPNRAKAILTQYRKVDFA